MASIQIRKETGCLIMDFYFQGFRCREQTALPDTATNRKKVQKVLDRIEADIAAGTFDYRRYFPASKNAARFDAAPAVSVAVTVTTPSAPAIAPTPLFKDFAETWYLEKEVEWRKSHRITVRRELDSLISRFGEKAVGQITKADVLAYRAELGKVTARGKETKLSAARINKMLNPLRQILNEAADRFNFPTPYCRAQAPAQKSFVPELNFTDGESVSLLGQMVVIRWGNAMYAPDWQATPQELWAKRPRHDKPELIASALEAALDAYLLKYLHGRAEQLAQSHGLTYRDIVLSNARTTWGTCRRDGLIRMNWRLVFLDAQLVDYVLAQGAGLLALEVKSGTHTGNVSGLDAFCAAHPAARPLVLGTGGLPLELWFASEAAF